MVLRKGQYDLSTRKPVIFAPIEKNKPDNKQYRIDSALQAHGHTVITLPHICVN